MKRILIFEDDCEYVNDCMMVFDDTGFELVHARDLFEFNEVFYKDLNWDIVIFNAWIEEDMKYTFSVVESVRAELGDKVRLVANSSADHLNQELIFHGCEIASGSNKKFNPVNLMKIVNRLV